MTAPERSPTDAPSDQRDQETPPTRADPSVLRCASAEKAINKWPLRVHGDTVERRKTYPKGTRC